MKLDGEQIDDRIVEVHWDAEREGWRMMRFRDDKPAGNHRSVVDKIINSIADGVEKDAVRPLVRPSSAFVDDVSFSSYRSSSHDPRLFAQHGKREPDSRILHRHRRRLLLPLHILNTAVHRLRVLIHRNLVR